MKEIICHLTSVHSANDVRIFHKECTSLANSGYEVHLVSSGNQLSESVDIIHHTFKVNNNSFRLFRMLLRSWRAYRLAKSTSASVFHIHDPELLPYGLLFKWQNKIVIYDAHENLPQDVMMKDWIPKYLRRPVAWLVEKIESYVAIRVDLVIAATPCILQRFQRVEVKVIELKNYPKSAEFSSIERVAITRATTQNICYVGLISLQRGIVELVNAIESMDVQLILSGAFVDEKTEHLVRALPGWCKVDYRGVVSRQTIANIFSQSSLGICTFLPTTAHNNALPNKLFEYMSAGLPIVASDFPLWHSIVSQAECGVCVNPTNVEEIKISIQWLLDNPENAQQMGQRGREAVLGFYNWESESVKLTESYRVLFDSSL